MVPTVSPQIIQQRPGSYTANINSLETLASATASRAKRQRFSQRDNTSLINISISRRSCFCKLSEAQTFSFSLLKKALEFARCFEAGDGGDVSSACPSLIS